MKRVLLVLTAILVIPGMLMAANSTLGVYFGNGQLHYDSPPLAPETFKGYLYIYAPHVVRSFQYQLCVDDSKISMVSIAYPWNMSLELGDPFTGHAVTYNPQLTCYGNGYDLCATFTFRINFGLTCADIPNFPMMIGPAPESFAIPHPEHGGLYGTYDTAIEENITFDIDGLCSYICADETDAETESWGAVKSMYR